MSDPLIISAIQDISVSFRKRLHPLKFLTFCLSQPAPDFARKKPFFFFLLALQKYGKDTGILTGILTVKLIPLYIVVCLAHI